MNDPEHHEDWRPSASFRNLRLRAQVLQHIRDFFAQRDVLEVETPLLGSSTNPDPHINCFITTYVGPQAAHGMPLYLQSSPEFAMKRLLSAGSGPIYQICKAFRQGERGCLHNPEFTILEWYRPGFDLEALIGEIEALLHSLFTAINRRLKACQIISYQDAFLNTLSLDPLQASAQELAGCARQHGVDVQGLHSEDRDAWLDVLMSHCVQPHLGRNRLTFVRDYPESQAALARLNPNNNQTALRFELFIDGVELANGFQELTDAGEQRHRFQRQLARRAHQNQAQPPMDEYLLQALSHGMPECSGVALGLDRLIMILAQATALSEITAFPIGRI
jgi:lysyl-tRNA synthetase class 2